jgi:DNA-binding NtrC family response regulator
MDERILLVEIEYSIRRSYREELERYGYQVTATNEREKAIDKLKDERFDLVVVDLESSENAEIEYLQRIIRADRNVKVVLNSDNRTTELDFRSWVADALLVLQNPTLLRHTIEEVLNSNHA